jgi:hypothetical protein
MTAKPARRVATVAPVAYQTARTEHAGAKNGGGYWGPRAEAKAQSKKVRRLYDRAAADEDWGEPDDEPEG